MNRIPVHFGRKNFCVNPIRIAEICQPGVSLGWPWALAEPLVNNPAASKQKAAILPTQNLLLSNAIIESPVRCMLYFLQNDTPFLVKGCRLTVYVTL
jgi:hypothetical protein